MTDECISPLRRRMIEDMTVRNFVAKTQTNYIRRVKNIAGFLGARTIAPIRVDFRQRNDVGTQDEGAFAAQWLACALPCQRFADALAGFCA